MRRREVFDERVNTFVGAITWPLKDESIARWQVPVCLLVAGLSREKGELLFRRVSAIATDAAVPLGAPDCAPNFLVVVSSDPQALLKAWWRRDTRLFNKERGVADIDHFIKAADPIRAWYNACSVPPGLATTFKMKGNLACNVGQVGSKLERDSVRAIYSVIVIVDLGKTQAIETSAMADYAGFVGLAQIRRNVDLAKAPTVLRLFAEDADAPRQGLTDWDRQFLKALYAVDPGRVTQLSEIKRRMRSALEP